MIPPNKLLPPLENGRSCTKESNNIPGGGGGRQNGSKSDRAAAASAREDPAGPPYGPGHGAAVGSWRIAPPHRGYTDIGYLGGVLVSMADVLLLRNIAPSPLQTRGETRGMCKPKVRSRLCALRAVLHVVGIFLCFSGDWLISMCLSC